MPFTEEYDELMHQLFPEMGKNSRIVTPLKGVRFSKVEIGRNVVINSDCLMMSAGGITIEDEVMSPEILQRLSNKFDSSLI